MKKLISVDSMPSLAWADVTLGAGAELAIGSGGVSLQITGDVDDAALVSLRLSNGDSVVAETEFRTRPDTTRWGRTDEDRQTFDDEFASLPKWPDRTFRLALEIRESTIRAWIDGRWVGETERPDFSDKPCEVIAVAENVRFTGTIVLPLDEWFVPIDPLALGMESSAVTSSEVDGIPFLHGTSSARIADTEYRGRNPYIYCTALSSDPRRLLMAAPRDTFDRVHLLCSVDNEDGNHGTVRYIQPGDGRGVWTDFEVTPGNAPGLVSIEMDAGAFRRMPLGKTGEPIAIDITRRLGRDNSRFPRPSDEPCGIRIHAVTLERAPFELAVTSDADAHVFETPEIPRFAISLASLRSEDQRIDVESIVRDPVGNERTAGAGIDVPAGATEDVDLELQQEMYGLFHLSVRATSGNRTLIRETTFAVLPPDTRKAGEDSPFGMWCFFEGHGGVPAKIAAPLFKKAGVRWTLASFALSNPETATELAKQGVGLTCANVACIHITCNENPPSTEELMEKMREFPPVREWLVFWETSISGQHQGTFPAELIGEPRRPLTVSEQAVLDTCIKTATAYAQAVREEFPDVKLVYGNGHPAFIDALMEAGYPAELMDGLGLDFDMFLSTPELQPGPLYAPFNDLYFLSRFQDRPGYDRLPRYLTEALYSPALPGWLTDQEQADIYVRAHLIGMASGVVLFGMCAELWDPCTDYFWSHYGPVGLLHSPPELNPRESFCAYATMTRELDQAHFEEVIDIGSPSAWLLRFRDDDGKSVFATWTVRGTRALSFADPDGNGRMADQYGNAATVDRCGGATTIEITGSPIYIRGIEEIDSATLSSPLYRKGPRDSHTIVMGNALSGWTADAEPDEWLEALGRFNGSIPSPYSRGGFTMEPDGDECVVAPQSTDQDPLMTRYLVLRPESPIAVDPDAQAIGAWIGGNSSWGRVVFELEDADGVIRRSVASDGYVDFDGECWVETRLVPGHPRERFGETRYDAWRTRDGGGPSAIPVKLAGIIVEVRTHVIRATDLSPVTEPAWRIEKIATTPEPVDPWEWSGIT
jgi:hypothetical protein